jgi:hypothetical protein
MAMLNNQRVNVVLCGLFMAPACLKGENLRPQVAGVTEATEARSCRHLRLRTNQSFLGKTRLAQQILYGLDNLYSKYHLWRCRELNQEYPILIYIPCRD